MTRVTGSGLCLLVVLTCVAGIACQLKRPETIPGRMIEPQLLAPQPPERAAQDTSGAIAASVRLLDTQARGHIGRRLLHQQPDGELIEDSVWRWSSAPDRYGHGPPSRIDVESCSAAGGCGQCTNGGRYTSRLASRNWRRDTTGWCCRVPGDADGPRCPDTSGAGK